MCRLLILLLLAVALSGCAMKRGGFSLSGGSRYRDPFLRVKQDGYGQGVGRDQYGRPVRYEVGY